MFILFYSFLFLFFFYTLSTLEKVFYFILLYFILFLLIPIGIVFTVWGESRGFLMCLHAQIHKYASTHIYIHIDTNRKVIGWNYMSAHCTLRECVFAMSSRRCNWYGELLKAHSGSESATFNAPYHSYFTHSHERHY